MIKKVKIAGEKMNIKEYFAKPDETIEQHVEKLIEVLRLLESYSYISKGKLYGLVEKACIHHDDGKANLEFQTRVKSEKKKKFNPDREVPHNVLSGYLLDRAEFETDEEYYKVLFAIMYHHNYGLPGEIIEEKKDLIKSLLTHLNSFPLKRRAINGVKNMLYDSEAVKIKGFLHKCDYSASGNYVAEYPNDFLIESLENVKKRWRKYNPNSDWNDLQKFCMEKRDENVIVVAQTGMGKTEAGLQWIGNHKGYFVLPLRTAINAIYDRIRKEILEEENINTRLSVLHSESLEYYFKQLDEENIDLLEYEQRGKRFSMPLSISTMDQLFDFVFKYMGYEMNLTTLSYSKIVIDEIQMYDPELLAYLIHGLKMITEMGGKVAIMTATLSPFLKELLLKEIPFREENIKTFTNDMVRHHVEVRDKRLDAEDIYELYGKNQREDKSNKILVVCNTVREAQKIYSELQEKLENPEELHIMHSRFTKRDRAVKEQEILEFGKTYDENGNVDKKFGIWISTSLVEASLDIDFDYLFTELQELNSLFQRFGRCNRKGVKDTTKPNCFVYVQIEQKTLTTADGFIDETIFNVSKMAIETVHGCLSETDKINLINQYLTMENLYKSDYYQGKERGYKKTLDWISGVPPYEFEKEDNQLRNILSADIIPSPIYQKYEEDIEAQVKILNNENAKKSEKIHAKEKLMNYTVSVPYWHWTKYKAAVRSGNADSYLGLRIGKFGEITIMECSYNEMGYKPLDYQNLIRTPEFL